jgi:hypothetical protein
MQRTILVIPKQYGPMHGRSHKSPVFLTSERNKRCGERLASVTSRYNTISNERDTLSEQRNALEAEQLRSGINPTRQLEVLDRIKEIDRRT